MPIPETGLRSRVSFSAAQHGHLDDFNNVLLGGSKVGELLRAGSVKAVTEVGCQFAAKAVVQQVRVLRRQQPPSLAPAHVHRPVGCTASQQHKRHISCGGLC